MVLVEEGAVADVDKTGVGEEIITTLEITPINKDTNPIPVPLPTPTDSLLIIKRMDPVGATIMEMDTPGTTAALIHSTRCCRSRWLQWWTRSETNSTIIFVAISNTPIFLKNIFSALYIDLCL